MEIFLDTANLEAEGTMQLVSAWITKFGDQLNGLLEDNKLKDIRDKMKRIFQNDADIQTIDISAEHDEIGLGVEPFIYQCLDVTSLELSVLLGDL